MPFFIFLFVVILVLIVTNIVIVPQEHVFVVEFLGQYKCTWQAGLHVKIPVVERIAKKVSLKEQVLDFPPQNVITKDNVSMQIDTVIYMRIMDAKLFAYGVESPLMAIENLTATALRNVVGNLTLDETLTSRDTINDQMQGNIDLATDPWGIKVNRVELKNIMPPRSIQDAMEKQMRAERERREAILQAEGQKQSQILVAEGEKQSAILRAEGEKETALLRAQAERQRRVEEALGEAEAILRVSEAEAASLDKIKAVVGEAGVLQLKAMEHMVSVADGQATKIIIPSEMQSIAGTLAGLKGVLEGAGQEQE